MRWEEALTLVSVLILDFIELAIPQLQTPLIGDILDLAGLIFCLIFLKWIGLLAFLEIAPGLDVLPIYTATWLIWYIHRKRREQATLEKRLDEWK
ncbi:MAG: hypothetical protein ACUVV4_08420 [Candidatus Bathyarchaeia archaeon]